MPANAGLEPGERLAVAPQPDQGQHLAEAGVAAVRDLLVVGEGSRRPSRPAQRLGESEVRLSAGGGLGRGQRVVSDGLVHAAARLAHGPDGELDPRRQRRIEPRRLREVRHRRLRVVARQVKGHAQVPVEHRIARRQREGLPEPGEGLRPVADGGGVEAPRPVVLRAGRGAAGAAGSPASRLGAAAIDRAGAQVDRLEPDRGQRLIALAEAIGAVERDARVHVRLPRRRPGDGHRPDRGRRP